MDRETRKRLLEGLLQELDEPFRIGGNFETNWTAPWLKVDAGHSIEILNYLEWFTEGRLVRVNMWLDERHGSGRILASVTGVPGSPEAINKAVAWLERLVGTMDENGRANVSFSQVDGVDAGPSRPSGRSWRLF